MRCPGQQALCVARAVPHCSHPPRHCVCVCVCVPAGPLCARCLPARMQLGGVLGDMGAGENVVIGMLDSG
jgi:hypothetical protein